MSIVAMRDVAGILSNLIAKTRTTFGVPYILRRERGQGKK